ncbi:hypothetical protein [Streptomyces sp. NPDC089799]
MIPATPTTMLWGFSGSLDWPQLMFGTGMVLVPVLPAAEVLGW